MQKLTEKRGLTARQQRFVDEYLVDLNASQAYQRAGYNARGNVAEAGASTLLRNPKVAEAVAIAQRARAERVQISADAVLREILALAMSDVRRLFDDHGRLLPAHQMPDDIAKAVSSIEVVTSRIPGTDPTEVEYTSKIKFWDKRASLELLGKHLKLFNDTPPPASITAVTVYVPNNGR